MPACQLLQEKSFISSSKRVEVGESERESFGSRHDPGVDWCLFASHNLNVGVVQGAAIQEFVGIILKADTCFQFVSYIFAKC